MGRDRVIRSLLRERFVISLSTGETFEGILLDADPSTLYVVDAFAITEDDKIRVDGKLFVPREHVAYMQAGVSA